VRRTASRQEDRRALFSQREDGIEVGVDDRSSGWLPCYSAQVRQFVLLTVVSLTCLTGCPEGRKCTPTNCSTGCCDGADTCQAGTQYNACGTNAATCAVCSIGQTCGAGLCSPSGVGGGIATGGGSASGGGTATGGGSASGGGGAVTPDTFVSTFLSAWCDRLARCGTWESTPASALECFELWNKQFDADLRAGLKRGAITLNQTIADTCLAQLKGTDCDSYFCPPSLFVGQIADGARCDSTYDCATPGSTCDGALICGRTCGPSGGLDQVCRSGSACAAGLYCEPNTVTCRPRLPAGSQCRRPSDCDAASLCSGTTCLALPTAGEPCSTGYPQCAGSAYCVGGVCAAKKGLGASCSYGQCADGLGCASGVCRAGDVGAVCRTSADCARREGGALACDEVMRTCQYQTYGLRPGASCTGSTQACQEVPCRNARVNPDGGIGSLGTCDLPQLGDDCTDGSSCPDRAACVDGHCVPSTTGAPCTPWSSNCLATDYCNSQQRCAPRFAQNALCDVANDSCLRPAVCADLDTDPFVYRCRAPGPAGTACRSDAGTSTTTCLEPYGCLGGQCVHAGLLGEPCRGKCFAGACVGADGGLTYGNGTCVPPQPNGADCRFSSGCMSGRCASTTFQCAQPCYVIR
jgi:hypothetical protein